MITDNAIQHGRHQLTERALEGVVIQAGGKLRVTAREIETMPNGSLAFSPMDDESVEFAFARHAFEAGSSPRKTISDPDARLVAIELAMSAAVLAAGGTLRLYAEHFPPPGFLAGGFKADGSIEFSFVRA